MYYICSTGIKLERKLFHGASSSLRATDGMESSPSMFLSSCWEIHYTDLTSRQPLTLCNLIWLYASLLSPIPPSSSRETEAKSGSSSPGKASPVHWMRENKDGGTLSQSDVLYFSIHKVDWTKAGGTRLFPVYSVVVYRSRWRDLLLHHLKQLKVFFSSKKVDWNVSSYKGPALFLAVGLRGWSQTLDLTPPFFFYRMRVFWTYTPPPNSANKSN